jgi:hypothetical protein
VKPGTRYQPCFHDRRFPSGVGVGDDTHINALGGFDVYFLQEIINSSGPVLAVLGDDDLTRAARSALNSVAIPLQRVVLGAFPHPPGRHRDRRLGDCASAWICFFSFTHGITAASGGSTY